MARILEGTNIHAAPASGAQVIVHIDGILNDDSPIAVRTTLDSFDARMSQGGDQGMTSYLQVQWAELEIQIFRVIGKGSGSAGVLQEVNRFRDPDQGQAGLREVLRHLKGSVTGAYQENGFFQVAG
jgi:hypothetical protein